MATTVHLKVAIDALVKELAQSWSSDLATALGTPSTQEAIAVAALIDRARRGEPSSLPYVLASKGRVLWVSVGRSSRGLLDYAEDLRSWVLQGYGVAGDVEFVQGVEGGRLAKIVQGVSSSGYLRWGSATSTLPNVLGVLSQMHAFMDRMPVAVSESIPSIHVLRFRFVSALRCGDWGIAATVIDEIDRLGLEQAHKTMQMRLRLLGESGDHAGLMETVERHHLWSLAHPTRVAEAILEAFLNVVVAPLEADFSPRDVCEQLRPWYQRLVQVLPKVSPHGGLTRLFAYVACQDRDGTSAEALLPELTDSLAQFVKETCGLSIQDDVVAPGGPSPSIEMRPLSITIDQATPSVATAYWVDLQRLVRNGSPTALGLHLSELDARVLSQASFLDQVPDVLLELISDPEIDSRPAARDALQEVLTCLVDVSISAPGFPTPKHLNLYLSLAESLVYLRGSYASEEDAHLLHGLLAAIANLSGPATHQCVDLLRSWWKARPVVPRLSWLLAVMESLAPLHPDPGAMLDLWSDAVALATRKSLTMTLSQYRTWQRVGTLLELDADTVSSELSRYRPVDHATESDPLAVVNWKKIAIVSLQESAAREAAKELHSRTGADVLVVSSLVQDGLTKTAEAADVIFLVWAACSHSVYRAFDGHRDRLVYVQGTGTSSILNAAERVAERTLVAIA